MKLINSGKLIVLTHGRNQKSTNARGERIFEEKGREEERYEQKFQM